MNPVLDHIKNGPAAITAARSCDLNQLSAEALVEVSRVANQIVREAQALALAATAAGSRKNAHRSAGAPSMNSFIAETTGVSRADAARQVKLAEHLESAPVLAEQMTKPGMSSAKAQVVAQTVEKLPYGLTDEDRDIIEADLAQAAPGMSLEQLRRKAKRAVEVVDRERADRIENARLTHQEDQQARNASFWMAQPDEAGMVKGGFEIDILTADMLRSVLESKTSPLVWIHGHRRFPTQALSRDEGAGEPAWRVSDTRRGAPSAPWRPRRRGRHPDGHHCGGLATWPH